MGVRRGGSLSWGWRGAAHAGRTFVQALLLIFVLGAAPWIAVSYDHAPVAHGLVAPAGAADDSPAAPHHPDAPCAWCQWLAAFATALPNVILALVALDGFARLRFAGSAVSGGEGRRRVRRMTTGPPPAAFAG